MFSSKPVAKQCQCQREQNQHCCTSGCFCKIAVILLTRVTAHIVPSPDRCVHHTSTEINFQNPAAPPHLSVVGKDYNNEKFLCFYFIFLFYFLIFFCFWLFLFFVSLLTSVVVDVALVLGRVTRSAIVVGERLEAGRPQSELVCSGWIIQARAVHQWDVGAVEGVQTASMRSMAFVTRERIRLKIWTIQSVVKDIFKSFSFIMVNFKLYTIKGRIISNIGFIGRKIQYVYDNQIQLI